MTTESWDWVVDALADELTAVPSATRQQVLRNLIRRAGYETTDTEFELEARVRNARIMLVRRLVARIETAETPRSRIQPVPVQPVPGLLLRASNDGR